MQQHTIYKHTIYKKNNINKIIFLSMIFLGATKSFGMQPEQNLGHSNLEKNRPEKNRYGIWGWLCCAACCVLPEDEEQQVADQALLEVGQEIRELGGGIVPIEEWESGQEAPGRGRSVRSKSGHTRPVGVQAHGQAGRLSQAQQIALVQETEAEEKERLAKRRIIEEKQKQEDQFFVSLVQQGDTARVRECLEKDSVCYWGAYLRKGPYAECVGFWDGTDRTTDLNLTARALLKYRQTHNLVAQKDEHLDWLACLALLQIDPEATKTLLQAGAGAKTLETAEFTWEQIRKTANLMRCGVSGRMDVVYTPLHYFLQFKKREPGVDLHTPAYDAIIQQLVAAGVDFHKPTPTGNVPYLEASKHDQEVIKKAEKAQKKQLRQAVSSAKKQTSATPRLQPDFFTPDSVADLNRKAEQAERARIAREVARFTKNVQQQSSRAPEQRAQELEQDAPVQNTRVRERSAQAVGLEEKNPEEASGQQPENKSAQKSKSELVMSESDLLHMLEKDLARRHADMERLSALAHKSFERQDSVHKKSQKHEEQQETRAALEEVRQVFANQDRDLRKKLAERR
jgi:hypothetical protein